MEKPSCLKKGDHVAIISLSRGLLGESFCAHQCKLGGKRLERMGYNVTFTTNAKKGLSYLDSHPEARAEDLKEAFMDDSVKAVICAIGGDDTYRTLPFLMDDESFKHKVVTNPKIFIGFSDTTVNHMMFYRLGMESFYGPNFLTDIAELSQTMLPYTENSFYSLCKHRPEDIVSSPVWYQERTDYSLSALGTDRAKRRETHGYETISGAFPVTGRLWGGCLESIAKEAKRDTYGLLLKESEWDDKVAFFETSEDQPTPEVFEREVEAIEKLGVFRHARAIIVGKPMDEKYYDEYKAIWTRHADGLPVLFNLNFGHACPRTLLAYGAEVTVMQDKIVYLEDVLR